MWISNLDSDLGAVSLTGRAVRQRSESLRGETLTVAEGQQPKTIPQKPAKRRTRLVFLAGTGVYRAIAAVAHQVSHSRLGAAVALWAGIEGAVSHPPSSYFKFVNNHAHPLGRGDANR